MRCCFEACSSLRKPTIPVARCSPHVLNEGATGDVLQSASVGAGSAVTVQTEVALLPDVLVRLSPTGSVKILLPDPGNVYAVGGFMPLTL